MQGHPEAGGSESVELELHVEGIVQGVGFRPFVYRLALQEGIAGSVRNTGQGVIIRIRASAGAVAAFVSRLQQEVPPLARIDRLHRRPLESPLTGQGFTIETSTRKGPAATLISPDTAICGDCRSEILDPGDRRYDYPFTNCTNCGPRLTIITRIPYDRPHTSMAGFRMCSHCQAEYDDPADRRFHAQPNGCPVCGPSLSWHDSLGTLLSRDNCLDLAAAALAAGRIVAMRGLGGFHLAVDATSAEAVERLRQRKRRYDKPLAIMAADLAAARMVARIGAQAEEVLASPQSPIVLLPGREGILAGQVSPGIDEIGIMLPYTPMHHLLFQRSRCPRWLVMTSGNLAGEPICTGNREALTRLGDVADWFLLHDREIVTRVDDSVVRPTRRGIQMLRRSRGYVPLPLAVHRHVGGLLACGAELKNTFCLGRDGEAFLSQHIGDLKDPASLSFFEESIRLFRQILEVEVTGLVCDLHPDYLSSRYGRSLDMEVLPVQHHHAHGAAIMAEHGLEQALAVVLDGTGLGTDRTVWGGEILMIDPTGFRRLAHLLPVPQPGGDLAGRQIWRMAFSLARISGLPVDALELPVSPGECQVLARMMARGINTPLSSSCGRLFDGVAALLGLRWEVSYEAQAAMELEALSRQAPGTADHRSRYGVEIRQEKGRLIVDSRPMLRHLLADRRSGRPVPLIGRDFHCWLRQSLLVVLERLREMTGENRVVLAGGCFQNRLLLEQMLNCLEEQGFQPYTGEQVPVNDGSISLGQLMVAAWRRDERR